LPAGHALLVVQRGPGAGNRFLLDVDDVNAGRHPDSEIFLDDVTVSRRHAEFRREGDLFTVADAGSLNGTYVNRDRIDKVLPKRQAVLTRLEGDANTKGSIAWLNARATTATSAGNAELAKLYTDKAALRSQVLDPLKTV
ncbi:FHA domain-containing protein, partial [Bradyrhizobium sp. NBAIM08]|nr:FHA domain-containing protein [Bradyrhizobium sp. NBAIM08]